MKRGPRALLFALVASLVTGALPSRLMAQDAAPMAQAPAPSTEAPPPSTPTITGVMVHGNHTTPDTVVLAIARVQPCQPFTDTTAQEVTGRLRTSGRFRSVDVRKRFVSSSDENAVLLVIVVEERSGISIDVPVPGPMRRLAASTMWLPVLGYEDGYGFTYGARISLVDLLGRSTRLSAPLTWGGERRASVLVERTFERGPLSRIEASGGVWRREQPAADIPERRSFAVARVERAFGSSFRVGARGETGDVAFGTLDDRIRIVGIDGVLDTRRDPAFPRNAVYASVAWERLWFDKSADTSRVRTDLRGYLGLPGQAVVLARWQQSVAADPLPVYEQALLGGTGSLRGFRLGYRAGDRLAAASLELRLPVTSPLRLARFGVAVFGDRGAVCAADASLRSADYDTGVGAGIFATAPALSFGLDVAHGLDAGTRAHVSLGVRF